MFVCPHGTIQLPLNVFSKKFDISVFFETVSRKFKFPQKLTKITDTLHKDQNTLLSCLARLFKEWYSFRQKLQKNQKAHFMFNNFFFFENCAVYDIMWKNTVQLGRPQMTTWRMCNACWIPRTTNTTQNMSQKRICCSLIMSSLPLAWSVEWTIHDSLRQLPCPRFLSADRVLHMPPQEAKGREVWWPGRPHP